jgi:RNA recognition motif-containing protein
VKKLFFGNLSFSTTGEDLAELCREFGEVTSASVATDRETGRSRGFGFVEMQDGADEAIQALNNRELNGRNLTVNEARPREDRPRGGGGGGGYGGGGGGGSGGGGGRSGGGGGGYGGGGGGGRGGYGGGGGGRSGGGGGYGGGGGGRGGYGGDR